MSEVDKENLDSENETETEEEETVEEETTEETEDTTEDTEDSTEESDESEELAELKEKNKKLFERAKKAEGEAKELKKKAPKAEPEVETKTEPKEKELTAKDAIVLMGAKVTDEGDITEVLAYADFKEISVAKALESTVMKGILSENADERKTAEATDTGKSKRSSEKVSDETLLARAEKGEFPDDPSELAEAQLNKLKQQIKD